jgi:hypothetical protein
LRREICVQGGAIGAETNNLLILIFAWWYGQGFLKLLKYLKALIIYLTDLFSVRLIFLTLFAPWKRDQAGYRGLALNEKFYVLMMNLVSRFVGFLVKSMFFLIYLIFLAVLLLISGVAIIAWLLMPLLAAGLIIEGIIKIRGS